MLKRFAFLALFFGAGILPFPVLGETTPSAVAQGFQDSLIAVMKDAKKLGVRGRYERLAPVVEKTFHLPTMSYMAAGEEFWKSATPEQRKVLVQSFKRMSVSTLATLFSGYSGERFTITGERDGPQNTRIIDTVLTKSDSSTNAISYIARRVGERWYLIDVVVDRGISEISVRRSEYVRVLRDSGLDGLIAVLNGKADELLMAAADKK
ncbi:MAG: hypothetical protein FJX42_05860 [Alphaproteobacteria bacterium]|nr:hypothetical protein [Alphaproteobacteria bacterium]